MIWLIGMGGSLGAAARFMVGDFISKRAKTVHSFPWGTWVVNILGSFILGLLAQLHLSNEINDWLWFFGGVGFCGAFTTFSTFGNEAVTLIQSNKIKLAAIYVVTSVTMGVISAMIGFCI